MRERPILFNDAMVRRILAGEKSQTRRPAKLGAFFSYPGVAVVRYERHPFSPSALRGTPAEGVLPGEDRMAWVAYDAWENAIGCCEAHELRAPARPGDTLWVRECWGIVNDFPDPDPFAVMYRAGGPRVQVSSAHQEAASLVDHEYGEQWRPSIHMPRWASRLSLPVSAVRLERIRCVTEDDARAEGMSLPACTYGASDDGRLCGKNSCPRHGRLDRFTRAFETSWNRTYPGSWERNDWVWVVSFERLTGGPS